MGRALFYLGPLVAWSVVIFISSTAHGDFIHTLEGARSLLRQLGGEPISRFDENTLYSVNLAARRVAHVVSFGVFTLLALRALQWGRPRLRRTSVAGALALCLLYSLSDDLHRLYVPGRHAHLQNQLLNAGGGLLFVGVCAAYFAVKNWENNTAPCVKPGKNGNTNETSPEESVPYP